MTGCVHGIIKSRFSLASGTVALTMVVSVTDPKLLIKILQVTFTGGPAERNKNIAIDIEAKIQPHQHLCKWLEMKTKLKWDCEINVRLQKNKKVLPWGS